MPSSSTSAHRQSYRQRRHRFHHIGLLFCLLIVSAAVLSYNWPFRTPFPSSPSTTETNIWLSLWFGQVRPVRWGQLWRSHRVAQVGPSDKPTPLFNKETDWHYYMLDSNCIAWVFKMSMDADVITTFMRFAPEVIWHTGTQTTSLERGYDAVPECFDRSS